MFQPKNKAFDAFLESFQEIDLPITLTEDLSVLFSAENKPLKSEHIAEFLAPIDSEIDEFTEFVPCFKLKDIHQFEVIVYWKAMLMEHKYVMATYSPAGVSIDVRAVSVISHDDSGVTRSIATIDEDWQIVIAKGVESDDVEYDPTSSKMLVLEIMPDGKIMRGDKR